MESDNKRFLLAKSLSLFQSFLFNFVPMNMTQGSRGMYPGFLPRPGKWITDLVASNVRQRVPVPINIQQFGAAIEEEWDYIAQTTINSLIYSMCWTSQSAWGKWFSHQILTVFLIHTTTFFKVSVANRCISLYSQSCEIHRLGPNEFTHTHQHFSIDWFQRPGVSSLGTKWGGTTPGRD